MPAAFRRIAVAALALTTLVGCRAQQLQQDQDSIRVSIMDMYTNQIMDNLVRAHNGYPFVQMQYKSITGTVGHDGSIGASMADVGSRLMNISLGGGQPNQLTVTANPIIDNDAVYLAYIDFVRPEAGNFVCTCEPPPCGAAHINVSCDDMHYWVPASRKHEFLRLSLATSVMSKGGGIKIPQSYTTTVNGLSDLQGTNDLAVTKSAADKASAGRKFGVPYELKVRFEDFIPASVGTLTCRVNGKEENFALAPIVVTSKPEEGAASEGQATNYLKISWKYGDKPEHIKIAPAELAKALIGQTVKVDIPKYRPGFGTTGDVLGALQHEMHLFRLNQQSQ